MSKDFTLPELGENVNSATIAKVLVSKGDTIAANDGVLELETDKAVVEIPCPYGGKITALNVKDGQTINVGDTILTVEESGAGGGDADAEEPPKAEKPAAKQSATSSGAKRQDAPKLTVLDKPEKAKNNAEAQAPPSETAASAPTEAPKPRKGPILASPSVRRLAREKGVDLRLVPLADPNGPITAQDVLTYADGMNEAQKPKDTPAPASAVPSSPPKSTPSTSVTPSRSAAIPENLGRYDDRWGQVAVEPMNAVRRKTASHMEHCWTTIPHVNHFEKADITSLEALRKQYGKKVAAQGGKLTITCFIMKVVAEALKRFPRFNATLDIENDQILLKEYYHLGVAADTENGLLVPVIRDVDQKSITDLAIELPEIAQRARDRKLDIKEMQGATFTISNLGGLGVSSFTPIINAPEVAIMGVSRAQIEPVHQNGQFVPRLMLPISISYDHRAIDGADAARFMRWVVTALEQPWLLWLED